MSIYTKDQYLDKDIPFLISVEIMEYDIKSAGYNLCKYYNLLPQSTLHELENLSKDERHIKIGLLEKYDNEFKERLSNAFIDIRKWFFEANNIPEEKVLSIKKDAIFLLQPVFITSIENIEFRLKNQYTSYYYINKKEFYVNRNTIDVKGISDDKLLQHRDYILDFLHKFFLMMETAPKESLIRELSSFTTHYKTKDLEIGYYRELNDEGCYRYMHPFVNFPIGITDTRTLEGINISYNYMNYIVPLIQYIMNR